MALAQQYGLTVYDAAYLELAVRNGAALATSDIALAKAAKKAGGPRAASPFHRSVFRWWLTGRRGGTMYPGCVMDTG